MEGFETARARGRGRCRNRRRDLRVRPAEDRRLPRRVGRRQDALVGGRRPPRRSDALEPRHVRAALDGGAARPPFPARRSSSPRPRRHPPTSLRREWRSGWHSPSRCFAPGGSPSSAVGLAVAVTGVWNQLAMLAFPTVALVLLALTGDAHAALDTIAVPRARDPRGRRRGLRGGPEHSEARPLDRRPDGPDRVPRAASGPERSR